jgi:hypothetical protein
MSNVNEFSGSQWAIRVTIPGNAEPLFNKRFTSAEGLTEQEIKDYAAAVYAWMEVNEPARANSRDFQFTKNEVNSTETDTSFGWNGDGTWYDSTV